VGDATLDAAALELVVNALLEPGNAMEEPTALDTTLLLDPPDVDERTGPEAALTPIEAVRDVPAAEDAHAPNADDDGVAPCPPEVQANSHPPARPAFHVTLCMRVSRLDAWPFWNASTGKSRNDHPGHCAASGAHRGPARGSAAASRLRGLGIAC